jgi:hypothetical protein
MRRVTVIAVALVLVLATGALAASTVLKGKTYEGSTSTSYFDHEGAHSGGSARALGLKVASSGKTVTVTFTGGVPLFYCSVGVALVGQSTKAASISHAGSFKASVVEKLSPEPAAPVQELVTGRFTGKLVKGSVKTEAGSCSGSTTFTAHAP